MNNDTQTPTAFYEDWPAMWAQLRECEGDERDGVSEQLDALWIEQYSAEFMQIALSRGWSKEDAESWLPETAEATLCKCRDNEPCPISCARLDVPQCEMDAS